MSIYDCIEVSQLSYLYSIELKVPYVVLKLYTLSTEVKFQLRVNSVIGQAVVQWVRRMLVSVVHLPI